MIIIRMLGGFASQLRQYNIAFEISKAVGTDFGVDLCDYDNGYFRPYVLNLLNLPKCEYPKRRRIQKAYHACNGHALLEWFDSENRHSQDVYIDGEATAFGEFFEKYPQFFTSEKSELLKNVSLKNQGGLLKEFRELISDENSIGVHIRLGDFENIGWGRGFEFYKQRLGVLLKKNPETKVFFFSNEIDRVIEVFGNKPNFFYLKHHNGYIGDIEEFLCLAMCRNKIISPKSGYSTLAVYVGIQAYGASKVMDFQDSELESGIEFLNEYLKTSDCLETPNLLGDVKPHEIREDVMERNSECFSKKELASFWQKQSGIVPNKDVLYVYSSIINYNRWFISGLFKEAYDMAKAGGNVLFIANRCEDSFGMPYDKVTSAFDMDGKAMGFDICLKKISPKSNERIINECISIREYSGKRIEFKRDSFSALGKKVIKKIWK